jgi:cell division initiation protein
MKVTPLELRQRQFATVMRGYDRAEVNTILALAADDYEAALRDNERLRQELGKFEAVLNEHRGQERNLSNTLLTAQKMADDIRERAEQDAKRVIAEAEGRAALLVEKSHLRIEEMRREMDALRAKRREVEASIEGIINTLNKTVQTVREQDARHNHNTSSLLLPNRDAKPEAKTDKATADMAADGKREPAPMAVPVANSVALVASQARGN